MPDLPESGYDDGLVVQEAKPKLKRPPLYNVVLLNDDFTPMEFVVHVLEQFFGMDREKAVRPFLDRLFRPNPDLLVPKDDQTIVCRCEEVTAGDIREAMELGSPGPNQLKTQTRAGMGPCQGRMCGLIMSEMIAEQRKVAMADVGYLRIRPPIKPITVGQLSEIQPGTGCTA